MLSKWWGPNRQTQPQLMQMHWPMWIESCWKRKLRKSRCWLALDLCHHTPFWWMPLCQVWTILLQIPLQFYSPKIYRACEAANCVYSASHVEQKWMGRKTAGIWSGEICPERTRSLRFLHQFAIWSQGYESQPGLLLLNLVSTRLTKDSLWCHQYCKRIWILHYLCLYIF